MDISIVRFYRYVIIYIKKKTVKTLINYISVTKINKRTHNNIGRKLQKKFKKCNTCIKIVLTKKIIYIYI